MLISIEQLLDLPDLKVLNIEVKEQQITIDVESGVDHSICHKCGQPATKFHGYGETIPLRHLAIFNRPVYLYLHTKRYRCLDCDDEPTTTQRLDWYDAPAGCTRAFAEFMLLELIDSAISDVVRKPLCANIP